jgi:hypothetical protein
MSAADWMLPSEAFAFLEHRLPKPRATIVELGSGEGTEVLRRMGYVVSIEHDERWLRPAEQRGHVIHAPIVDGWYDPAAIAERLPPEFDCLVVDGPTGDIGRMGLLKHLGLFNLATRDVPLLVDDVHRPAERELALELARSRGRPLSVHMLPSARAFATIGWETL